MSFIDFTDSEQIDVIFQEAVDKAMLLCVAVYHKGISEGVLKDTAPHISFRTMSFRAASYAIAKHEESGESIAVADKNGKVVIVAPEDIDRLQLQKIQK